MLATLRFLLLLGLPLTYAATNIIDASDPSISFSPGWTEEFSQATQDSYLQADGFGCSLVATLPSGASSVSYVAFTRAGGSSYGYALDCQDDCVLQTVDGSDPSVTDDASVDPSTIFSIDLDPSTQHTLRVYNIPSDQPDGSSEITFNNLAVDVQDGDGGVPVPGTFPSLSPLPDPSQTATDSSSSSSSPQTFIVNSTSFSFPVTPSSTSSSGSVGTASITPSSPTTTVRTTSSHLTSSGDTRSGTGSSSSSSSTDGAATPTNPPLPHITSSPTGSAASSNSSATTGPSKSVIIGVSILVVVLAAVIVAVLVVFLRQRRQRARDSFQSSSQPPPSPTGSLIPIMPPPEMRTASFNPFADPYYPQSSLDGSSSSSQRRMESRSVSPGAPPNIPLPDIPIDRRDRMEGRTNSPATPFARNDLWITRSPARAQFSVV